MNIKKLFFIAIPILFIIIITLIIVLFIVVYKAPTASSYTNEDAILSELSLAINNSNTILYNSDNYAVSFSGGDGDEYAISSGVAIWDNINKTIEFRQNESWFINQFPEMPDGLCRVHYITNPDNTTYLKDHTCSKNISTENYTYLGQWVTPDPIELSKNYKDAYLNIQFSRIKKWIDEDGYTNFSFRSTVSYNTGLQDAFFESVKADQGPTGLDYYFKFDTDGKLIEGVKQLGFGSLEFEIIY